MHSPFRVLSLSFAFFLFGSLSWAGAPATVDYSAIANCEVTLGLVNRLNPKVLEKAYATSKVKMLENISPYRNLKDGKDGFFKGSVLAAPSHADSELGTPNYIAEWRRDAGIAINMLVDLYLDSREKNNPDQDFLLQLLMDHMASTKRFQETDNNTGPARVDRAKNSFYPAFGEAKIQMDGKPFKEGWMNPQTDGPAYSLKGLLRLTQIVWDDWNVFFSKDSVVRTNLARSDLYNNDGDVDQNRSIIKRFFEYLNHNWHTPSFDMWEEEKGLHFATLGAHQSVLLVEGPEFTAKVGDPLAGEEYKKTALRIEEELKTFWDPDLKLIRPSKNVVFSNLVKNNAPKTQNIDSQVVIGLCHMKSPTFTPASDYALSTVFKQEQVFRKIYPINHGEDFVLIGRYPEDIYSGGPERKGQPWFLTTFYFAEHSYKVATELKNRGRLTITDLNVDFFNYVLNQTHSEGVVKKGMQLSSQDPFFNEIIESLIERGDGIVQRTLQFAGSDGSMSEQIDPGKDGIKGIRKQRSAPSLTWSYAAFFRAYKARQNAIKKIINVIQ